MSNITRIQFQHAAQYCSNHKGINAKRKYITNEYILLRLSLWQKKSKRVMYGYLRIIKSGCHRLKPFLKKKTIITITHKIIILIKAKREPTKPISSTWPRKVTLTEREKLFMATYNKLPNKWRVILKYFQSMENCTLSSHIHSELHSLNSW